MWCRGGGLVTGRQDVGGTGFVLSWNETDLWVDGPFVGCGLAGLAVCLGFSLGF